MPTPGRGWAKPLVFPQLPPLVHSMQQRAFCQHVQGLQPLAVSKTSLHARHPCFDAGITADNTPLLPGHLPQTLT